MKYVALLVMKIQYFSGYSLPYFCCFLLPPPFPLGFISFKAGSVPLSQEYLHAHFTQGSANPCLCATAVDGTNLQTERAKSGTTF